MRARLVVFLIVGVSCVVALLFLRELVRSRGLNRDAFVEKKMRLLSYATFVSPGGPGPELIKKFQDDCQCKVDVTSVSDAGLLLERLKIGQNGASFDLVLGLDQLLLESARKDFAWRQFDAEMNWRAEIQSFVTDDEFLPVDWSPMTFVYRESSAPVPQKWNDLTDPQFKGQFLLQDPRASSPGLQFYNWIGAVEGDRRGEFLRRFKPNVQSVSPSWAFSYGQFKKNQGRFVFSYLTSLAFHWGIENDRSVRILNFPEGHPVQVEYAAIPAQCQQCDLAVQFMEALLTPESQRLIMEKNFMRPVIDGVEDGTIYSELPELKLLPIDSGKDLRDWDQVFSR